MLQMSMRVTLLLALLLAPLLTQAQAPTPPTTIAARTAAMHHIPGFLPLDWDATTGKLYLEILHLNTDLLYTNSLPYGTGSNDLGLDRGQVSEGRILHFERSGPKVLLVQPNQDFRTSSTDPAEQLAVTQSFPESILFGFTVAAEDPTGAVLVDATDFFLRDAHRVTETLESLKQGAYKVDPTRSTIALDDTKAFPRNTEVEAILTFTTDTPPQGKFVRDVTPDPHAMTLRERHSFIELPPPGFTPRAFNPRAGYFPTSYRDYTTPLGESLDKRFIIRHRLIKKDPNCVTACEPIAPIQYYVDRGAPEPIRTALLEGARWWDQAFQAAGWAPNTFRVDLLPADADPMDVRYNIIQWVHRYTRGWSYGEAVTDPRTGEIIKGNVTLGSLRARQDYLIAEALLSPYSKDSTAVKHFLLQSGPADAPAVEVEFSPMLTMVLARIRQLAAHETGHTLGLAHNFAASSISQSDSVMDYPHPYVTLDKEGHPDLSHAYATNIGAWDKVAINYGYRDFGQTNNPSGEKIQDHVFLDAILTTADKAGQLFITDEDARPFGSAHPHAHLWDNGPDAATELDRVLTVRAAALKNFGENAIRPGTPMSQLEDTLVPLYLFHRYQTEATIKVIAGLDYRYNLRGDGQPNPEIVPPADQKKALEAVLKTLTPETLTLPESLLKILPPTPPGYPRTQESFPSQTGLTFDPIAAAESAADLTLQVLLDPARASRLIQYHMRVPASPSLRSVLEAISTTVSERPEAGHSMSSEVERAVEFRSLEAMLSLAVNPEASTQARAIARSHIDDLLKQWTSAPPLTDTAEAIHRAALINRIQDFNRDPEKFIPAKPIPAPPGMPIGDDEIM
jgi:Met-zincin/Domain of unknown function (DUF5117)